MNARKLSYRPGIAGSALLVAVLWVAASAGAAIASPTLQLSRTIKTSPFVNSSISVKDAEGSAYVPQDHSIWLADDNGRAIWEVDPSSGALKTMIGGSAFEATPRFGGGSVALSRARRSRPMPIGWLHVLFWAGLRGAVAVAMALSLPPDLPQRELLQDVAFGIVLFTLFVQGTTAELVVRRASPARGVEAGGVEA